MKKLQKQVQEMYTNNDWDTVPELLLIAMQEELGEIAGRFVAEHPDYKKSLNGTNPIPEEVGDLVTLILAFCNKMDIDAEEWVSNILQKRKKQG